jgi:glyoxylase-like metal-dependent hydrolase (beta-lactamase superfamily II)
MRFTVLPAHNPGPYTGDGTNTYFLPGSVPTLIDAGAGHPDHIADLAAAIAASTDEVEIPLRQVLVTHAHVDHAGGAPALAVRWPEARFAKRPWPEQDGRYPVRWEPIADNAFVPAGDVSLWAIHTPGHSPDHLCFLEPNSGILFAGDLVINDGTVVIPASHGGSLSDYLHSLRRLLEIQPGRILPGHGRPIDHPAALLRGYIAHRLSRERQILDALGGGPLAIPAIVDRVYAGLREELRPAAADSVLAHLIKLRDEGGVKQGARHEGDDLWQLIARG